jgi:AcrR family transcriptional regulator
MKKDSEATRQRILEAAIVEFAEYGIAGARIDRIATAAASNKQLIYQYFQNKDELFRTVLKRELTLAAEGVAFPPDDVERYAGAYFDFAMANPRMMRLIAWCGLEAKSQIEGISAQPKLDLLTAAQQSGKVSFQPSRRSAWLGCRTTGTGARSTPMQPRMLPDTGNRSCGWSA